ncbi:hypothetical protein EV363DRAFT_1270889 [Boletus edulis]|uniref:Uncharacterized protein n=1 Tax=Boletus edulis BED1 TaxID=1328754 RepID=A0AAD4G580_BOLED|nr:hypothetical protein EV363DRAFT_1270889 [Boletus edulis]KAF8414784.1 hypothetical protein L210DRAFT_2864017 [Boletus edulis BED1]
MVRVYRLSHGDTYSSIACTKLGAAAFIRVPATHVLYSFATSAASISRLDITMDAARPFDLITLCQVSSNVMSCMNFGRTRTGCQ